MDKRKPKYDTFKGGSETEDGEERSMDEYINAIGIGKFHIKLALISGLAWLADCMEIQVIGLLGPVLGFEWLLSSFQVSLISATVFLGTSIGAPMFGYIGDKYGRKTVLMLGAALTCFYGLLSAFSPHFIWILILRSLVGVGVAAQSQAVSYFSEFLPAKSRGRGVAFLAIAYSLGAILEACLAVLILDPYGWQLWLMVSALPMLVFLFFMSFFPESPRFLNTSGFNSKAMLTLRMVADENSAHLPKGMLKRDKKVETGDVRSLLRKEYLRITALTWSIAFIQTFLLYGIIMASTLLVARGGTCNTSGPVDLFAQPCQVGRHGMQSKNYVDLMITSVADLGGALLNLVIIDVVGRKWTLMIASFGFCLSVSSLHFCFGGNLLVAILFIARLFASSYAGCSWIYIAEIYTTNMRGIALGMCASVSRIGAIVTSFCATLLMAYSVKTAAIVFACVALCGCIASALLPVETKGRFLDAGPK